MAVIIAANNASTTIANSISSTNTTITLATGTGAAFPSPTGDQAFKLSLTDAVTRLQHEITLCTSRTGDVCTVLRGQEGTTAQAWSAGDIAANLPTAGTIASTVQADQLQQNVYQFGVATGTADIITLTLPSNLTALSDGMLITFKSTASNTVNNPTLTLTLGTTVLGPYGIVKGANVTLATGDIPGAYGDVQMIFNTTFGAWVLLNPTTSPASTTITQPTGSVIMWTNVTPPTGWLLCNGQAVSRTSYSGLFSILGISFGSGDGSTTFNLPNYQGFMPIGAGGAYGLASQGGAATLSVPNLPSHNHSAVSTSTSTSNSVSNSTATSNSVSTSTPSGTAISTSVSTPTGSAVSTSTSTTTGSAVSTSTSNTTGSATAVSTSSFTGNALGLHTHSAVDSGHIHNIPYRPNASSSGGGGFDVAYPQPTSYNTATGFANVTIGNSSAGTPSGSVSTSTAVTLVGLGTTTTTNTALTLNTSTNTSTSLTLSVPVATTTALTLSVPVATTTTTTVNTTTGTTTGTVTDTTIGNTGSGVAFNTISPYLAIYFIIRT
jgi:microcystin-dependent protein